MSEQKNPPKLEFVTQNPFSLLHCYPFTALFFAVTHREHKLEVFDLVLFPVTQFTTKLSQLLFNIDSPWF